MLLLLCKRNGITKYCRKRKLNFEWQRNILNLKGQTGTGGSGLPLNLMQNAVTARADTAENICSLGSLVSFRRSFWHLVGTLIPMEGQTG